MKVGEKLGIKASSRFEDKLVELKAKVDDLDVVKRKLASLGAHYMGTFRQNDVYFNVPEGRLKLREVEGSKEAELVYYERENIVGPKRSDVFIMKIQEPAVFKILLEKLLKTRAIVEKVREIYQYQGTLLASKRRYVKIHLDKVKELGMFVEFEMKTSDQTVERDRQILWNLMDELGIKPEQLERLSYVDLIS